MIVGIFFFILTVNICAREIILMSQDSVKWSDVNTLTFNQGHNTTKKFYYLGKEYVTPQLNCLGGSAESKKNKIKTIECMKVTNIELDKENYFWKCESPFPKAFKLDNVEVSCASCCYPDNLFMFVGSCSLEYTLETVCECENFDKP